MNSQEPNSEQPDMEAPEFAPEEIFEGAAEQEGQDAPKPKKEGFRKKVRASTDKSDPRPSMRIPAGDSEVTPFFAALGLNLKGEIFVKNDGVCTLTEKDSRTVFRFPGSVALPEVLETSVKFVKISSKKNEEGEQETTEKRVTLPEKLAKKALESKALKAGLREIRAVESVCLPVLRDGKLEKLPKGYDAASKVHSGDRVEYRTDMSLEEAKNFLDTLFGDFPFVTPRSKSVVMALAVSEFVKYLLPQGVLRPAIATQANASGPGKTVALQLALGAVHGFVAATGFPKNSEEIRKKVAGAFAAGERILLYDNVEGYCNDATLCGVITSVIWADRILCTTSQDSWRHESQICISGNNLKLGADMLGRTLVCDLRQDQERPALRRVKDPFSEAMLSGHRADYLAALWTLTRNWIEAGQPEGTVWGRFEAWCKAVGGIITAAGYADPCEVVSSAETDADGDDMRSLVTQLGTLGLPEHGIDCEAATSQKWGVTPEKIRAYIVDEELFADRLAGSKSPHSAGSVVGSILREWTDRECGGWRLRNDGKHGKRRKYWVEKIA